MFNKSLWNRELRNDGYPFFGHRNKKADGETNELVLGPSVAPVLRWLILALVVLGLLWKGVDPTVLVGFLQWLRIF